MPSGQIDHINGVRSDNRWTNLRDVPKLINSHNELGTRCNNTSGAAGVHQNPKGGRWIAQIGVSGKTQYLGSFDTIEEARMARLIAKRDIHSGFAG
jgi:hypothetical protein